MAGVLSRFSLATEITTQELKNSSKYVNTTKSTLFWFSIWKKWCADKEILDEMERYEPLELNTLLERSYAEVKNKRGKDNDPDSLKVMITSLDRYLKNKGSFPSFETENLQLRSKF